MTNVWTPPKPVVKLEGTITYRCAGCGGNIESGAASEWIMHPLDERGDMTPDTRTYHPDHVPQEMTDGS